MKLTFTPQKFAIGPYPMSLLSSLHLCSLFLPFGMFRKIIRQV